MSYSSGSQLVVHQDIRMFLWVSMTQYSSVINRTRIVRLKYDVL